MSVLRERDSIERGDAAEASSQAINDKSFVDDLATVRKLLSFLFEQAEQLALNEAYLLSLGSLNSLKYNPAGRAATEQEWKKLESLRLKLTGHLTEPLRRRFRNTRLPWWIVPVALGLVLIAIGTLIGCILMWHQAMERSTVLVWYILWLSALGGIGSLASIGMNALSIQDDATFDLSNTKQLVVRASLGVIFAVVLTLPFGFDSFFEFMKHLNSANASKSDGFTGLVGQAGLLLFPFILGFSTSLVVMILNQFADAVMSFLGRGPPRSRNQ